MLEAYGSGLRPLRQSCDLLGSPASVLQRAPAAAAPTVTSRHRSQRRQPLSRQWLLLPGRARFAMRLAVLAGPLEQLLQQSRVRGRWRVRRLGGRARAGERAEQRAAGPCRAVHSILASLQTRLGERRRREERASRAASRRILVDLRARPQRPLDGQCSRGTLSNAAQISLQLALAPPHAAVPSLDSSVSPILISRSPRYGSPPVRQARLAWLQVS